MKSLKRLAVAALFLGGCGPPDPMAQFQPGERGRVTRIVDGDALVLDTGQSVRLIGIEAPAPERRDRPGEDFAKESARMLEDMALGREVRLYYAGLTRDRYDRALAHAVTDDDLGPRFWLNREMAAKGGARVRVYPDTALGSDALVTAETAARESGLGLWARDAYEVRRASDLGEDVFRFQVVDGILGDTEPSEYGACERAMLSSWLRLEIGPMAQDLCALPAGRRVEVRGYISRGEMEVTHPLNLREVPR